MSNTQQADDNMLYASRASIGMLSEAQTDAIRNAGDKMRSFLSIPCTACDYCAVCPQDIAISRIFAIANRLQADGDGVKARADYAALGERNAASCVQCGMCVEQCPQHISVFEELAKQHKRFT
jgi:predicted aldo/keto reductase-like oxidoreductase